MSPAALSHLCGPCMTIGDCSWYKKLDEIVDKHKEQEMPISDDDRRTFEDYLYNVKGLDRAGKRQSNLLSTYRYATTIKREGLSAEICEALLGGIKDRKTTRSCPMCKDFDSLRDLGLPESHFERITNALQFSKEQDYSSPAPKGDGPEPRTFVDFVTTEQETMPAPLSVPCVVVNGTNDNEAVEVISVYTEDDPEVQCEWDHLVYDTRRAPEPKVSVLSEDQSR